MRVLAITGAGISAESGIPTFRGADGHWRNLNPLELATPEACARNPALVWEWYEERRAGIRNAEPNPAHYSLVKLALQADDFLLVTQNVDDLHARAGMPREQMLQIHGDIFVTRCSKCTFISPNEHSDSIDTDLPDCPRCGALLRPGVVWFGEQLDPNAVERVENFLERGTPDWIFVIGTTALFGYIIDWATRSRARLIEINPEETSLSGLATESIRAPAGAALPRIVNDLVESPPSSRRIKTCE